MLIAFCSAIRSSIVSLPPEVEKVRLTAAAGPRPVRNMCDLVLLLPVLSRSSNLQEILVSAISLAEIAPAPIASLHMLPGWWSGCFHVNLRALPRTAREMSNHPSQTAEQTDFRIPTHHNTPLMPHRSNKEDTGKEPTVEAVPSGSPSLLLASPCPPLHGWIINGVVGTDP